MSPRPRLIERLNAGLLGKLTLIAAPAGFGKTTLVSEWVSQFGSDSPQAKSSQKSERVRRFLLQISILDRLSGPLCDAVTGQEEGSVRLQALERGNFFVVPLMAACLPVYSTISRISLPRTAVQPYPPPVGELK